MKIKNWKEFQHYKDRDPKWIKLYTKLLNDDEWFDLDPRHAKVLVMLWLLASEDQLLEGNLPPIKKIAFRLRISESSLESILSGLSHWVEQPASNQLANCYQSASLETETETETETEKSIPLRATVVKDEFFIELKKNPAYAHIDMERENGKMDAWLALPANRNRIKTRKFVLNWLNKIEAPLPNAPQQETAIEKFLRRGS